MAARQGFGKRIRAGWWYGLRQRDPVIWISTLLIVVQVLVVPYLGLRKIATGHVVGSGDDFSLANLFVRSAPDPDASDPPSVGQSGWTYRQSTDMSPVPRYNPRNRRLPAYTPVRVIGAASDGKWMRVQATLHDGSRVSGFVMTDRLISADPTSDAEPETGTVIVRGRDAPLLAAPAMDAVMVGTAAVGTKLTVHARVRRGELMKGVPGDYLLVDSGSKGQAWILANRVKKP
ncbi:MAG: hypothetical protein GC151_13495 [Betaproteobacteria bacterium]|nr:hypothetical protein [Betaproteobacteria bacterium]